MIERGLMARIQKCLTKAAFHAEASAQQLNPSPLHRNSAHSDGRPKGVAWSTYDTMVKSLTEWCELQEKALKSPGIKPESEEDFESRVRSYKGLTDKQIAQIERTSESRIQKIRQGHRSAA